MKHRLIHGDCLEVRGIWENIACIFADPPDNLGLPYGGYNDKKTDKQYLDWLYGHLDFFMLSAPIIWISYNAKWNSEMGDIVCDLLHNHPQFKTKSCVQVFTFGQHNHNDLGNNHRPLLRLAHENALLYPDQIRVESWRQKNGDKRADPRGRVPGDVFDFPRVTGNSKQRRRYCPTQLHEGLVERCIKLSTKEGDHVIDPFSGTGTTLRVCKRIKRRCTLIECNYEYCKQIAREHGMEIERLK